VDAGNIDSSAAARGEAEHYRETFLTTAQRGVSRKRTRRHNDKNFYSGYLRKEREAVRKVLASGRAPTWQKLAAARQLPVEYAPIPSHIPISISITANVKALCLRLIKAGENPARQVHLFKGNVKICEIGSLAIAAEHGVPQ
jgi:hypothetical protein